MPNENETKEPEEKKKYHSLSARVLRIILIGFLAVGLLMLIIGVGAHIYYSGYQTVSNAIKLTRTARDSIMVSVDPTEYGRKVIRIYRSMTPEERADVGSKEYYEKFESIEKESGYIQLESLLAHYMESEVADDLYYAVYDEETSALVYVADPSTDAGSICPIGYWEEVPKREIRKFGSIDGDEFAYDIGVTENNGLMATSGVSVKGSDGEPLGCILADNRFDTFLTQIQWFVMNYAFMLFVMIFIMGWFLLRHMKKTVIEPINSIANAAKEYAADKKEHNDVRDHFSSLEINTGDEIENLNIVMAGMETDLDEYERDLARISSDKEKILVELNLAQKIQKDMLPNVFPPFPERTDFDVYASMDPAKEVGGDFYDFFLVDDTHVAIEMADVSGKGIPAALFMMVVKSMLQNEMLEGRSPGEALTNINDRICQSEHEGLFITVWLGLLDLNTGILVASNAGHEYPAISQAGGKFEILHDKHCFVIGGLGGIKYKEYEIALEPGSKVFLYTDGVTEATDADNNMFGMDRMVEALNSEVGKDVADTLKVVTKSVDAFVGDAEQFDDMTMLCVEYKGQMKKNADNTNREVLVDVTLPAEIENQTIVTDKVDEELEKLDCPFKPMAQINIAIDEIFSNIAKYAYAPGKGDATVRMELEKEPEKAVVITFIDSGTPYDPMEEEDPDITLSAEERGIGGLGILMVKKSMDDLKYEYKDGKNIFMIKRVIE